MKKSTISKVLALMVAATLFATPCFAAGTCKDEQLKVYSEARSILASARGKGGQCKMMAENFMSVLSAIKGNERALQTLPDTHQLWCDYAQASRNNELQILYINLEGCF